MIRPFLERVFLLTGGLTVFLCLVGFAAGGWEWTWRFAAASLICGLNWFGLALVLTGVTTGRPLVLLAGALLKLSCLTSLVVFFRHAGVDLASFIPALHVFFAAALAQTLFDRFLARLRTPAPIPAAAVAALEASAPSAR